MLIHGAFVRGSHGALVRGKRTLPFRARSACFLEVVWFRSWMALRLVAGAAVVPFLRSVAEGPAVLLCALT